LASRQHPFSFAALLTVSAAIRIFVNNVTEFSRADETVYLHYTQVLAGGGRYAEIVRMFIDDRGMWVFPNPLRWSYLGATTLFCSLAGECTHRTLAALSTVSGIAAVALTYWIGLQLFERRTALFAAALMATSPLQLALGRRALSDEFFCAMVLASIAALLAGRPGFSPAARNAGLKPGLPHSIAWVVLTTLAFAAKEQFLFIYPVVLLFWWLRERKIRWEWLLPPALFFGVFCVLARDVGSFFRIARIITSVMDAPYARQYQSGPPHRLLIDFLLIAPIVTIAFIAAAVIACSGGRFGRRAAESGRPHTQLLVLAAGILIVHSLISSKNLRYVVTADPMMRLLVASALPRGRWTIAFLAVNAAVELALFHIIFVANSVYDPVTYELLHALKMVPL
jgi:4-amino-4-deoxy-L-arabinose transferase-like glycosyltransferase